MAALSRMGIAGALLLNCYLPVTAAPVHGRALLRPILQFAGANAYDAGGQHWVRHRYVVRNWSAFPNQMFAPAPELPPCGLNRNAARSWIDIYDSAGKRLYGFCALQKSADLRCIWFATELGATPPAKVYIEITDRANGKTYRSNLASTGPALPDPSASAAAEAAGNSRCSSGGVSKS